MPKRKTHTEFIEEVNALYGNEYEVRSEYNGSKSPIIMYHVSCGREYETIPNRVLNGRRCRLCYTNHKKTSEQFNLEVKKLTDNDYELVGEYKSALSSTKIKHIQCNSIFCCRPNDFLNGKRCPKCETDYSYRKKTTAQFKKEVFDLTGDDYTVLSSYKNSKTEIIFRHNVCENTFEMTPNNFLERKKHHCRVCNRERLIESMRKKEDREEKRTNRTKAKRIYWTEEEFLNAVKDIYGDEYTVLSPFTRLKDKVKVRHKKCGKTSMRLPSLMLQGRACRECSFKEQGTKRRQTTEQFKLQVYEMHGTDYEVLGEYTKTDTPIRMKHTVCGHEYDMLAASVKRGNGCPNCYIHSSQKTTEDFKLDVKRLVGEEYSVVGEYIHHRKQVLMKHNDCGTQYPVKPNEFLKGSRCPVCRKSKGELKISQFLSRMNIAFIPQYKLDDCKNIYPLPFDFAVMEKESILFLIEYDGEQHFVPKKFFGGKKGLEDRQRNDEIKNQYCQDNNIPLVRIPYWDFDRIEEILTESLFNYNSKELVSF